jgi:hypothetical protein
MLLTTIPLGIILCVIGWIRFALASNEQLITRWNESTVVSIQKNNISINIPDRFDASDESIIQGHHAVYFNDSLQNAHSIQKHRDLLLHFLFCVRTDQDLRDAVKNARTVGPTYTRIDICSRQLKISGIADNVTGYTGIDVSNKWIDLRCQKLWGRCTLDGQKLYSILYGRNANIKTHRIDFVHGRVNRPERAPITFAFSNVTISQSLFRHNFGLNVGCLYMISHSTKQSSLILQDVTIDNNNGYVCSHHVVVQSMLSIYRVIILSNL